MQNENDINLINAAIIGENIEASFFIEENNRLHAVDMRVASLKKEECNPESIIPLMRDALKALVKFAEGKVPPHLTRIDWKAFSGKTNEQQELISHIEQIYSHLHHQDRNNLSSLIHHKAR